MCVCFVNASKVEYCFKFIVFFYLLELSLSLATEKEENKLLQEQLSTMEVVTVTVIKSLARYNLGIKFTAKFKS